MNKNKLKHFFLIHGIWNKWSTITTYIFEPLLRWYFICNKRNRRTALKKFIWLTQEFLQGRPLLTAFVRLQFHAGNSLLVSFFGRHAANIFTLQSTKISPLVDTARLLWPCATLATNSEVGICPTFGTGVLLISRQYRE